MKKEKEKKKIGKSDFYLTSNRQCLACVCTYVCLPRNFQAEKYLNGNIHNIKARACIAPHSSRRNK